MSRDPPTKPRRRTYRTGGILPELTDEYRPIPLGLDENDEPDGQIRAFAVNVINRSDRSVFIREGPEGSAIDEAEIPRFQSYTIWENNGINRVNLRGSEGGEDLEIRTLEAHNDFGIRDRLEAFVRAVSHFFASNKQETVITGAETVINSNITGSDVAIDTTIGDVAEGVTFASNITGQDVPLDTTIGDVAEGVTFNSNISGQDVPIDTTIGDVAEGVTINSNISGQDLSLNTEIGDVAEGVQINSDITAQSVGNINVLDIEGKQYRRFFQDTTSRTFPATDLDADGRSDTGRWYLLRPAPEDGFLQSVECRFYDEDSSNPRLDELALQVGYRRPDDGFGDTTYLLPRGVQSVRAIDAFAKRTQDAHISRYDEDYECVFRWEPKTPLKFSAGSEIDIIIYKPTYFSGGSANTDGIEISAAYTLREDI